MKMPDWWNQRRLGLFVHASVATVPAWAPIGEYAEWYRSHLGEDVADVVLHPQPAVEVLAHHRDRWGHIDRYDDFVDLLEFNRFDAEQWASLAVDSGAGYTIFVSKHHDGWTWWDAPNTANRLTEHGPKRNVLAEYAAACERHDVVFGTYFSLLDWGDDRYPDDTFVTEVMHPQVLDLVERHGTAMLWGDGHWNHDAGVWQTAELLRRVREIDPDVVFNDRWRASSRDVPDGAPDIVRTFEYQCPEDIVDGPWELNRGLAHSFGHNRAEPAEHHMTAAEIIDLYTEVLAKGGNLLLNVGPAADGCVPDEQSAPLRSAGRWIRRHADLLSPCRPWTTWGDRRVRYLTSDDGLIAIDLTGRGLFPDLASPVCAIAAVTDANGDEIAWEHGETGLVVRPADRTDEFPIVVCRVTLTDVEAPDALFDLGLGSPIPLAGLLAGASQGDVVQLGDGVYQGPVTIPPGVTIRGLGPDRTTICSSEESQTSIIPVAPTVSIGHNARLEHLHVADISTDSGRVAAVSIAIDDDAATVLGCQVDGSITVTGDDVLLRAVNARGVRAERADRIHVSRCQFRGNRWDVGVELIGGGGQHIESSEFGGHLCAIRISDTTGATVRGNAITARWWGVHLQRTEGAHVHGNRFARTMRAIDVDAGRETVVDGNAAHDGDSGCVVQNGAVACEVYGNHWDRCRVGLLAWDAVDLHHQDNVTISLHEPDGVFVTGPS